MTLNPFRQAICPDTPHTTDWYQGRSVYGGLVFAQLAHQLKKHSSLPLRRLSIDMCAPVMKGDIQIQITPARVNANSHFFYVALIQSEKIAAHGTAVCGGARRTDFDQQAIAAPESIPPAHPPLPYNKLMPAFTQFFEYWPTIGALPFSGATNLLTGGWIRSRHDTIIDDEMILALIDAWWPCLILATTAPRPMGTISFSIDFAVTEPFEQKEPCLIENMSQEISEGYSIESNTLWSAQGKLLARAQQNVVLIR